MAAALRLLAKHEPDAWTDTQEQSCKGALASLYRAETDGRNDDAVSGGSVVM